MYYLKAFQKKDLFSTPTTKVKGSEINTNNNVSINFLWKELERQVTINGQVEHFKRSLKIFQISPNRTSNKRLGINAKVQKILTEWMIEREQSMLSKFGTGKFLTPSFGDSILLLKKLSFART